LRVLPALLRAASSLRYSALTTTSAST
jgi:hypothetical protein